MLVCFRNENNCLFESDLYELAEKIILDFKKNKIKKIEDFCSCESIFNIIEETKSLRSKYKATVKTKGKNIFVVNIIELIKNKNENYLDIVYDLNKNKLFIDRCVEYNYKNLSQNEDYYNLSKLLKIELDNDKNISRVEFLFLIKDSYYNSNCVFDYIYETYKNKYYNKNTINDYEYINYKNKFFYQYLKKEILENKIIEDDFLDKITLISDISLTEPIKKIYNFLPKFDIEKRNTKLITDINGKYKYE